jgi:hypothetical protein
MDGKQSKEQAVAAPFFGQNGCRRHVLAFLRFSEI